MNRDSKLQKALYWVLSYTWGIVMTLAGSLVAVVLIITGHKPKKFGWDIYFNVGKWWGGLELGPFFLVDSFDDLETKCHEHGHGFQNIIVGPLFPFLVGIPSSIRYWLREFHTHTKRTIYCCVLSAVLISISIVGLVLGSIYVEWLKWVSLTLFFYFVMLSAWLFEELKKHKDKFPLYDDFFPEGNATQTGKKFMGIEEFI